MRPFQLIRWGGQPQFPASVITASGLSLGMSAVLLPAAGNGPRDQIGGLAFAAQGGTVVKGTTAAAFGWDVATTGTDGQQAAVSLASGYPISFGLVFVPGTLGSNVNLVNVCNSAVVNSRSRLGLRVGTSTVDAYSLGPTGTASASASPNAPTVGGVNTAVGVFASNASRKVYLNGQAGTLDTTSITPTGLTNTCIGSAAATTRQNGQVGQYLLAVFWNRALSDAEAITFTRDPWQIFAPPKRALSFIDALTGTFASTLGDLVAAFAGSVAATGTFASTLGDVTAAFSGAVTGGSTSLIQRISMRMGLSLS
jgi:hypothetical protein